MKVIVFGGSGFLGSHVCDKLSDTGYEVVIFDLVSSQWLRPDQKMIVGDILDEDAVQKAVEQADIVYNFAGIADISEANGRPIDSVRYNILGNTNILEASRKAGVKRFIFASTVYVYSKSGGFYRCSKQACEAYIETYHENYGLEYTILRYGSLYGPRSDERNGIYRYILHGLRDKKIHYLGRPDALREYIHVEDAALCSLEILKPEHINQSVILTGHQPMRVRNVLEMIAEMLGEDIELKFESIPYDGHYDVTPYSFSPKIGKKFAPPLHTDIGQGFLKVIEEIHNKLHPELHNVYGVLVKE